MGRAPPGAVLHFPEWSIEHETHNALGATALALVLAGSAPALAAADPDLAAIRREIGAIRHDYETRIRALETRLRKAEADARAAQGRRRAGKPAHGCRSTCATQAPVVVAEAAPVPAPELSYTAPVTAPASAGAFNPGIAAVLNGFYAASSRDPDDAAHSGLRHRRRDRAIPHGFSLGESEVSFAANIDPLLAGFLDFSFDNDNQPDVEEAYIRTTRLGGGFTVKAGRFLSGIGYLNERHAHDWSFSDAPLPYRAFLNNQYGDDGVQVRWLAPTNIFLEFGAEWFRGDAFPAGGAAQQRRGHGHGLRAHRRRHQRHRSS